MICEEPYPYMNFLRRLFRPAMDEPAKTPTEPDADASKIRLVVGLGNPGTEYDGTRHNVGFDLLDAMAKEAGQKWERDKKGKARVCTIQDVIFAKPQTFMNLSGTSVARICRAKGITREQILVVYDDVDTELGKIKFKPKGSAGGHNGIKSIIEFMGGNDFPRLKIGIGASAGEMTDHVLGRFEPEEQEVLEKSLAQGAEGVMYALAFGLDSAMNEFNRREKKPKNLEQT
ncbi:MAG: aminoacyl-tRNA hydrolase [Verrucomicrobiota bacterium]